MSDLINTVDTQGNRIGTIEKLEAHKIGQLHEAFSIFVFNSAGETLLQKRNPEKYHSGGLWTNTCCSHPRVGEDLEIAIHRRLQEEMGFDCELTPAFPFIYRAELANGLIEHEFDYVYVGNSDALPKPNSEEVSEYKWIDMKNLQNDLQENPHLYTAWLKILFDEHFINLDDSRESCARA